MKQTLIIKDFKVFEDQKITLKSLTVLAGSNSVGKSSIIQALLLSRHVYDKNLDYGDDVSGINISLNGPYHLELGNTTEVVRRGAKISEETELSFLLFENDEPLFEINFQADISNIFRYEMKVSKALFYIVGKFLLANNFYYSAAERIGPRLKYEFLPQAFPHSGYRGERSFQILSGPNSPVNKKLLLNDDAALLKVQVYEWLEFIIPGTNFQFAELIGKSGTIEGTYGGSLPTNVGFGISYVLPIIVNGLLAEPNSTLIVENPEAHLHPSGQSRIGRFLTWVAGSDIQVIVETHSEHVINGIRVASMEGRISNEEIVVNYVSKDSSGNIKIEEIDITKLGDLTNYPKGFFDQEQSDIAELIKLKMK